MNKLISTLFFLTIILAPLTGLYAHHNTNTEFAWFDTPAVTFEGKIVRIAWGNPHVSIDVESTGGDIPAGEKWRLVSHPINITVQHSGRL